MGQLIQVDASPMGTVALFSTDRSLTGQDGVGITPRALDGADPPHELARRLFDADQLIDHVHVLSNTVSVRRRESWDDEAIGRASDIIANLFIHYVPVSSPAEADEFEGLRVANYNATLSHIRAHNEELWVMRVTPDEPIDPFLPGPVHDVGPGLLGAEGGRGPRQSEARSGPKDGAPVIFRLEFDDR